MTLYLIDLSQADPDKMSELRASYASWDVVEESPEERARRLEEGLAAVAEYEAEYGAITPEQEAWADTVLDGLGFGTTRIGVRHHV